jgi:hypothetical protein
VERSGSEVSGHRPVTRAALRTWHPIQAVSCWVADWESAVTGRPATPGNPALLGRLRRLRLPAFRTGPADQFRLRLRRPLLPLAHLLLLSECSTPCRATDHRRVPNQLLESLKLGCEPHFSAIAQKSCRAVEAVRMRIPDRRRDRELRAWAPSVERLPRGTPPDSGLERFRSHSGQWGILRPGLYLAALWGRESQPQTTQGPGSRNGGSPCFARTSSSR